MSYRRPDAPPPREYDRSYGYQRDDRVGRNYPDRRGPPPERNYRDDHDSRRSRRSMSPPYPRGDYPSRDRRDERYHDRKDRDYAREAPPPRDYRSSRHEQPPAPRGEEYSRSSRRGSPLRRVERDRRDEDDRSRQYSKQEEKSARNAVNKAKQSNEKIADGEEAGGTQNEEEVDMMAAMGFGGFGSTKNTKVEGNQTGAAEVKKERTWRQYMQRKGGFNRPLSPVRK